MRARRYPVTLKAEIIKLNELISSVPVLNVCVSTDNQSYSGTETRSYVRNKKSVRSPVTKEQVSKYQTTAYKSNSSVQNKRETQSHKFTQPSVLLSSIPLHPKLSPQKNSILCCMVLMNVPQVCQDPPDKNLICPLLQLFSLY